MGSVIYLDHNATTPVLPEVLEAMTPCFTERWGNPSSSYRFGAGLKGVIEVAREKVAALVATRPAEIAFTTDLTFHGIESEALLPLLDQEGICASSGSACLADSDEPSHVVKAMKPDAGASRQMIRFSLGIDNTMPEVEATISAVRRAVEALRG
jgi:cysteine sulfinate desulfinase/cysteine desulfurase-like protein